MKTFIKTGEIVLACNRAFGGLVAKFQAKAGSADLARKEPTRHLISGIILQPCARSR